MSKLIYDTRLKFDVANGYIPEVLKHYVNSSNHYKWKKEQFHHIIGFDYYNDQEMETKILSKEITDLKVSLKKSQAENELLSLLANAATDYISTDKLIHNIKNKVVNAITKNREVLGIKKCVKMFNIAIRTFYTWQQLTKAPCVHTIKTTCLKSNPNSLLKEEELNIVRILKDPRYFHYPLKSLMWMAKHEDIVHASFPTWARLKEEHQIKRTKPKDMKRLNYRGLKAIRPNQYLHADITLFKLPSHKMYYIYIVKDNYSKMIKSWAITEKVSAATRVETFKQALTDINFKSKQDITFITDQGTENNNKLVRSFFDQLKGVQIKFALRDIPYSNSMVERFNMDLKYMYLYRETINSLKELTECIKYAVNEHNYLKRMGALNGLTPNEVYQGISPNEKWFKLKTEKAKIKRRHVAKKTICCYKEQD